MNHKMRKHLKYLMKNPHPVYNIHLTAIEQAIEYACFLSMKFGLTREEIKEEFIRIYPYDEKSIDEMLNTLNWDEENE